MISPPRVSDIEDARHAAVGLANGAASPLGVRNDRRGTRALGPTDPFAAASSTNVTPERNGHRRQR